MADGKRKESDNGRIAWHPAFAEAMRAELIDYLDKLDFEVEHQLNREPLKIDVLIIKKTADVVIEKNLGAIFSLVNVVEYKSPSDHLTVADFHKVMAYAYLYISIEGLRQLDVTVTLVSQAHPRDLLKYLREDSGYAVEERYRGIYYALGGKIPVQIVVSGALGEDDNLWLKNLTDTVGVESGEKVFMRLANMPNKARMAAYLDVFFRANADVIKEVFDMANTRGLTLEDILENAGVNPKYWAEHGKIREGELPEIVSAVYAEARAEARARTLGKLEMARRLLRRGLTLEEISEAAEIPIETLEKVLSADA